MSEWITDRKPWAGDSDIMGKVWIFEENAVYWSDYSVVTLGTPWMPIKEPEPYVKPEPERFRPEVNQVYFSIVSHCVFNQAWLGTSGDHDRYAIGNCFETREQAEAALGKVKELLLSLHLGDEHDKS